ncbi:MAG: hypothetical protein GF341_02000 [candidate division Zixibacteria bacterium]|nr:hypothetical protein [candidate division Zixibacteria bacterium]
MAGPLRDRISQFDPDRLPKPTSTQAYPVWKTQVHYINDIWFGLETDGTLGTGRVYGLGDEEGDGASAPRRRDLLRYLEITWTPSLEFPPRTENDYLNYALLGFGCVRGIDTILLWTGFSDLLSYQDFSETSNRRTLGPLYDPEARAEQQFYLNMSDTSWLSYKWGYDYYDQRPYTPIGIEVHQTSYSWSMRFAKRFILIDYWIINVGDRPIVDGTVGLFIDPFVLNDKLWVPRDHPPKAISGCIPVTAGAVPEIVDTMNLVWWADNDGDPLTYSSWNIQCPTGIAGVRVLRMPPGGEFTFNWYAPIYSEHSNNLSWGPYRQSAFGATSAVGGPRNTRGWYRYMINGEIDYDQVYAAIDKSEEGWGPPYRVGRDAVDIADGHNPSMVVSSGQIDPIAPGDSVPFTIAFVVGEAFHRQPRNFVYYFDPYDPSDFVANLDFTDFLENAQWAGWLFDIPGYDTDGDGYRGEKYAINCTVYGCDSLYYKGDGVPDFRGPTPPTPPPFEVTTRPYSIHLRWSGGIPETEIDPMSGVRDFEGYRIYSGQFNADDQLSLIASWDIVDYKRLEYIQQTDTWKSNSHPYSIDEWKTILSDPDFDPRDYAKPDVRVAYVDSTADTVYNSIGQMWEIWTRRYSYWEPQDYNRHNVYEEAGQIEENVVQQVEVRDTIIGLDTLTYGIYEANITNLNAAVPLYFAVTTFDFGNNLIELQPLESYPANNSEYAEPIYSPEIVVDSNLRVMVYPNPYKLAYRDGHGEWTSYYEEGYEGRGILEFAEQDRRVHFINLPDTAMIRIYTLDGDLVRTIHHPDPFLTTYPSSVGWDLVTRNVQAAVSGIYIWRVDSKLGSQMGKLVIIK